MNSATFWITVANLLYVASYSVRDILWLRILTVLGALCLMPYYFLQPKPLIEAIAWGLLFVAINVYWIIRLILERRPIELSSDEARLREIAFPTLTPREARRLFKMGAWDDVTEGDSLVRRDAAGNRLSVILTGSADAMYGGTKVAELGEGQFVGALDRNASQLATDVVVRRTARVMCWPADSLNGFLATRPDVALSLERTLGFELRRLIEEKLTARMQT